ncbi:transposase domain-containing protein [Blautia obeum]|uniref:Uncharacterized homolog of phage Mu protein gp47 n=1 Tax=Blautia obeum TaxID=40520 RepID=A0A174T558_9FIRM|nr:transposase domain-containing protein [Blautia obeum]CUQ02825.1 Uncharacterized homolog of phage Mu protein gp47 [Blautia obeum]
MAESYVTLSEAAELEGIKYKTMAQRLSRKKQAFETKTEKSETGGKDVVLVAVSSLSKQARNAWKEREKLKSFTEEFPGEQEAEQKPEVPWYVNTDVDWYIENYKERYYKAVELGNVVRKFLQYDEGDRTKYAEEFAQKHLGKGQRTLYRYTKAYLEASAWADKLQKEDGAGYEFLKVLCLCRKPKETGCFPSIKPEVKQVIKNIWFNEDFARNQGTREMLYEKLNAIANINKWEKIPSYQTVTRYISYLMEDEGMKNAYFLASRGTREYKNKVMVKGSRDTKGLQVMQIVMGDEHTFDCWVSYKQPNGKVIAIKPHLAAWVDMRSRVIMGDVLCKDANSDILKQSLLKMLYSEPGGVPEYLYIDNGKDYTAKTMTGRDRNDRSGMNFDNETMGFYKSIGIKDDHRALPYEPWSKGQIERFFRTVCNKFTRWMKSYTGTLTGSKTSDKVDKDIKRMLERGELLTMEEFYEKWHEWLTTVYMHTEHSGLKKMGETYKKPYDCFMNEDRYFKAAPPKSYATMLMMKSDNVLVRNIGITKWGYEYRSDELCDYIGRKVDIKYDPDDMSSWAELATRTIEEKLRNAAKAVPGVLDARIDAQHPRGQGTVDVIIIGAAGEASPELIRKVGEAIEPLKGNYEDYLVKPSEVVRQDFELVIYLAEDAATDGVDGQAAKLIEDMMALTRGEMNTLYRDSIIHVLSAKIDNYRKTDILKPSEDMLLEQDKVIMAGDINVSVRNVAQSSREKE